MKYKLLTLALLMLIITGCTNEQSEPPETSEKEAVEAINSSRSEIIAANLEIPWAIAKHHNTFYITERIGRIARIDATTNDVQFENLNLTKEVAHVGEGGLLGVVLAPDFATSHLAYAYHTYSQDGNILNRVIQIKRDEDSWVETKELLANLPGGNIHNGGRMKIGPDDKLYITVGDAGNPNNAQNRNSLAGKILRMNLDGTIPDDNPFKNSYVYSYGHRNPQGLAWDEDGTLFSTEHGQTAHDEINLIQPGKNYGWPEIQGDEEKEGMVTPIFHTGTTTWAPSGLAYHDGMLYIATLRGEKVQRYHIKQKRTEIVFQNVGRMRDVYIEDNSLYTITSNLDGRGSPASDDDKLYKIKLGN